MKKYEVTIEETVCETFSVEVPDDADICEYVKKNYYDGKIVIEAGECQSRKMAIRDSSGVVLCDWQDF